MTADVQRELAEVYAKWTAAPYPPAQWQLDNGRDLAAALLPTVQALIADAEKRAAAAAAHEEQGHLTTVLANLLRLTYDVQLDSGTSAARKESERVADTFRRRIADYCRERDARIQRTRAAALDPSGADSGEGR